MKLKLKHESSEYHPGYGAGSGSVISEEYECPCSKGNVVYVKDDIPGFKDTSIFTDCIECREKYKFSRGYAVEKVTID